MIGILANGVGVIIGGLLGFLLSKKIKVKEENANLLLKIIGFVIFIIGLLGILKYMINVSIDNNGNTSLSSQYELELLLFLSIGTFLGNLLKIDNNMYKLGEKVEHKLNKGKFSEGMVNATLVFCMGAMGIVGSITSALTKDNSIMYTKALIDTIMAFIFACSLGFGVMFSGISIIIYFSIFYLLGFLMSSFFTNQEFLAVFSATGYSMVALIGINYLLYPSEIDKEKRIKIGNMIPSLLLVIIYYIFKIYVFKF